MQRQNNNQVVFIRTLAIHCTISQQQQYSSHVQLGHSLGEGLALHSEGRQPQSAHLIFSITRLYGYNTDRNKKISSSCWLLLLFRYQWIPSSIGLPPTDRPTTELNT